MTERLFSLNDVTTAMGPALAQAKAQHGGNPDRALDLFCQGVIDGLKALPDPAKPLLGDEPLIGDGLAFRAFASPND